MQPRKNRKAMKNVFIICMLLFLGKTLMAQMMGTGFEPDIPGYAGKVLVATRAYIGPNGKYTWDVAGVPYAQICLVDGKDTVRLTCDALGNYFWKTDKIPELLEYHITTAGFEKCIYPYEPKHEGKNWISPYVDPKKKLVEVIISTDKVEAILQGDTITFPVENAFKTFEGDFAGDLLRGLPDFAMQNGFLTLKGQPVDCVHLKGYSYRAFNQLAIDDIKRRVEIEKVARKKEKLNKRRK